MTAKSRLRLFSLRVKERPSIRYKLAALKAAKVLRCGGVIAHHTHTLPGIAANPFSSSSVERMCRFKQRQGPFLLLADSRKTAAGLVRFFSPKLRQTMQHVWPGSTTLTLPARPGLHTACYHGSLAAVRVDASAQVCCLARACGGVLLSSSLNRKGGNTLQPACKSFYRLQRHLNGRLQGVAGSGKASTILRIWRNRVTVIRP